MSNQRGTRWALAALGLVSWVSLVHGAEPPPVNHVEGTVVLQKDGQPAAGVPVAMVHRTKGYLRFDDNGLLGRGEDERLFGLFPKRNGRYACQAVTDASGHFVLRSFAAPEDEWMIAAGDAKSGYALMLHMAPAEYKDKPLRLELAEPAYIDVETPKTPKSMQLYTGVSLAGPVDGAGGDAGEDDPSERVYFRSTMRGDTKSRRERLGPLPSGQRYRVAGQGYGGSAPYTVALFEKVVEPAPGETAEVTLESKEGLTVTGRVTSTEDKSLANVNVKIKTADGTLIGGVSDADGKYELRGVPAGTHALQLLRHAKRTTAG